MPNVSCKKESPQPATAICDSVCIVTGSYSGTYTNHLNQTGSFAYTLEDDNFISGAGTLTAPPTAFGSYSNTCDSVKMKSWNTINNSYYYFAGKLSNNRTTITGIYKNLTTPSEIGSFTLIRQ